MPFISSLEIQFAIFKNVLFNIQRRAIKADPHQPIDYRWDDEKKVGELRGDIGAIE